MPWTRFERSGPRTTPQSSRRQRPRTQRNHRRHRRGIDEARWYFLDHPRDCPTVGSITPSQLAAPSPDALWPGAGATAGGVQAVTARTFTVALVVVCLGVVSLVATFSRSSNLFTRVVALSRRGRRPWAILNPAVGLGGGNLRVPGRHPRRHIGFGEARTDSDGGGSEESATPVVRQFAGVDDPAPEAAVATEGYVQQ
jgi:hypothetical protein